MRFSARTARLLLLEQQGLSQNPQHPAKNEDVLETVRRMGALQLDTIQVVARSQYIVLWSRLGAYQTAWLDELLAEGRLFEYWSHAACLLPIEDYPLYRRVMLDGMHGWMDGSQWLREHRDLVGAVLGRIRAEGGLRSADFENPNRKAGGWWSWKDEKHALEYLHTAGELMIARREKFQRIYDLRERVLPGWQDSAAPDSQSVRRALLLRTFKHLGLCPARWAADYYRLKKRGIREELEEAVQRGELLRAEVEGWAEPAYLHADLLPRAQELEQNPIAPQRTALLSPFDPLVWDRERAKAIFGFEYKIEVYLPASQRAYGYYSLPVLQRGEIIARLDAKAHRQQKALEVRSFHLEAGQDLDVDRASELADCLRDFAAWQGLGEIHASEKLPEALRRVLVG